MSNAKKRIIEIEFIDPKDDEINPQSATLLMLPFIPSGVAAAHDKDMMTLSSKMVHRINVGGKIIKDTGEIEDFFSSMTINSTALELIVEYMDSVVQTESRKKKLSGKSTQDS